MREREDLLNDRRRPGAPVAPEGTRFKTFDYVAREEREFVVAAACSSKRIRWHCIQHDLSFSYQGQLGEHTAVRGMRACILVAICLEHKGRPETIVAPRRSAAVMAEATR